MLGCDDAGFADIHATALNAAISGSIVVRAEGLRGDQKAPPSSTLNRGVHPLVPQQDAVIVVLSC